jgi:hypothetical protein
VQIDHHPMLGDGMMMTEILEAPATAWVARFERLLQETMPHLRRAAPELAEESLIQLASRLVELRLGAVVDLGGAMR